MAIYKEWYDSPIGPVIVTHHGTILVGSELADKALSPDEASLLATILAMASAQAKMVR